MMSGPSLSDPSNLRLIEQHTPLVEKIARNLVKSLPANVEFDDLLQDGMMGLIDAILRSSKTVAAAQFESYVAQRARGAMLDGLRASDPGSRKIRKEMRRIEAVLQQLSHQLGCPPTEGEVAAALDLPIADYQRLLQQAHGYTLISIDDLCDDDAGYLEQCASSNTDPLVVLERAALRQTLVAAIRSLSQQDRVLMRLYYEDGLKMHQVGQRMALSESRISQLHTQAIAQLRASLTGKAALLKPRRKPRLAD
jgi:RNA polymerase sigma factor for flagellar operon FliA